MSEANIISDEMEIAGVLKAFSQQKAKLWCWQNTKREDGTRPVHYCIVQKVDQMKNIFYIRPNNKNGFKFNEGEDIFIFSQERCVACKVSMRDYSKDAIILNIPDRFNVLDPTFIDKVELVEKEDEDANAHKRTAPRKAVAGDKMAGIRKITASGELDVLDFYTLHDMSAGGMGFMVSDPAEFEKNEKVVLISVDGKELPKAIAGTVMSIRQTDELVDSFKVGVKFG